MTKGSYSEHDILARLDQSAAKWNFVILDGGEGRPADVRLTAYRDEQRWAIVLEELMFFPASPGHGGIVDLLRPIGNCVADEKGPRRATSIKVTSDGAGAPAFVRPDQLEVDPRVSSIRIRGMLMPVDLSPAALARRGIPSSSGLRGQHLLWSLLPQYRALLLATDEERRSRLPADLPKFMELDEWNHPLIVSRGERPSDSESFQLLAKAISTGDPTEYQPKSPPNTDWRNWVSI